MENKSTNELLKDPQMIIAISVVILSVCALVVSVFQAKIMGEQRELMLKQAKAAVWPRLGLGISKSHNSKNDVIAYKIQVGNSGVGPAIIEGVRVSYNNEVVTNWWQLFEKFNLADSIETYVSNSSISEQVYQSGENSRILGLSNNLPLAQAFYEHSTKIKIEVFYKSIYDDMWKLTVPTLRGKERTKIEKVNSCTIPQDELFYD